MFEKYLSMTDASKASPEHIEEAYKLLKKYCEDSNLDMLKFVNDPQNIKPAAEHIHKELPMAVRWVLKKDKIESLILDNLDFIKAKTQELYEKENPAPVVAKKATKTTKKKT